MITSLVEAIDIQNKLASTPTLSKNLEIYKTSGELSKIENAIRLLMQKVNTIDYIGIQISEALSNNTLDNGLSLVSALVMKKDLSRSISNLSDMIDMVSSISEDMSDFIVELEKEHIKRIIERGKLVRDIEKAKSTIIVDIPDYVVNFLEMDLG